MVWYGMYGCMYTCIIYMILRLGEIPIEAVYPTINAW